jgi:hypothetical protein
MVDFATLKKNRQSQLEKLSKEAKSLQNNQFSNDDRYWYPDVDKAGNGYAVIRFLPPPANEEVPFVRLWEHGFQGPGGWYIEKSLTTLGKDDPVSEYNSELWNSGSEAKKEIARKQKRKLNFVSNIYVIADKAHPEREGKVYLFKYGKKIFDKLNEAMNPPAEFEDEKPINPFDLWEGADFKLKIRNVEGYRNYDKSEFDAPAALFDDDEKLEEVWKSTHSLQALIDPKEFKSYEELKARLNKVLGNVSGGAKSVTEEDLDDEVESPRAVSKTRPEPTRPEASTAITIDEDEEDSLSFFKKLAED